MARKAQKTSEATGPEGGPDTGSKSAPKRRNMRAADRERAIVDEAIRFFAEHGFEGQTRELAKRMGITHSAIYRHFPSKEALIERVYQEVYLSRWSPDWGPMIRDRSLSLEARLTRFYLDYVERVFEYNWVRIFVFSGMKSFGITGRYLDIVRREIIEPAAAELRHDLKLPDAKVPSARRTRDRAVLGPARPHLLSRHPQVHLRDADPGRSRRDRPRRRPDLHGRREDDDAEAAGARLSLATVARLGRSSPLSRAHSIALS